MHETPFKTPAVLCRESVRRPVAFVLIGLEAGIETHSIEEARVNLGGI